MLGRKKYINSSNNKTDANKNVCALAVAMTLKVENSVRYLHTINDLVKASRTKWVVRSRKSYVKGKTVGAIREEVKKLGAWYYIVRVDGHVVLLNSDGKTIVDTDPRKKDKRQITHLYGVYHPLTFDLMINKAKPIKIERVFYAQ